MPEQIAQLFAEYADAYTRGERPRAEEYLSRAGEEADELAGLLERFVQATPAREPDAATIAITEAMLGGEPPLVGLRTSRGVRVDEVVDALIERLGLDPTNRAKVKLYYERLEQGVLESARVSRRVWGAVAELLGAPAEDLASLRSRQVTAGDINLQADAPVASAMAPARMADEEQDEVDLLFMAGGDY